MNDRVRVEGMFGLTEKPGLPSTAAEEVIMLSESVLKAMIFNSANPFVKGSACSYVIAEIGNNHQGCIETAKRWLRRPQYVELTAKFQKRKNHKLFTDRFFESPYENPNSFGATYDFIENIWSSQ